MFTLRGRADRIERLADGRYAILDYKTGQVPTEKQVRIGISPQLTLEAAILRRGGFPGIAAGGSVAELVYVSLKGGEPAGEEQADRLQGRRRRRRMPSARSPSSQAVAQRFEDEQQPYLPLVLSMWKSRYGTYDHLARVKEWSVGGGEDDELGEGRMSAATAPASFPRRCCGVQVEASDPAVSAWVAANAGSGKTHVLAQRVIRLLLDGVDPAKILCITFTKAAAANMANRVFDELRRWTALDDAELDAAIRRIADIAPDAARRARARRLFAVALETPGGLKVQTIHAFCTRLLHQFPFEANVAARFEVLDEAAEAQLLERDQPRRAARAAAGSRTSALGRALAIAIASVADQTFKDVVGEAIRKRDAVRAWIDHGGSIEAAIAGLCGALGVTADDTIEQVENEIVEGPVLPASEWAAVAEVCTRARPEIRSRRAARGRIARPPARSASRLTSRCSSRPNSSRAPTS